MKKIWTILLVLAVCLAAVQIAFAAAPKPPGSICLRVDIQNYYLIMTTRSTSGSIKMKDGQVKLYSIDAILQTNTFNMPMTGTGFMEGNEFVYTMVGSYNMNSSIIGQINMTGRLNVSVSPKEGPIAIDWSGTQDNPASTMELPCIDRPVHTYTSP
jgi:hypothetical protein